MRKVLLETPIFTVSDNVIVDPAKNKIRRILVEHGGSAVVMPVDADGRVMLVRQYRYPARDYLWELPGGKIDEGESPLQAAKRELKEETGLTARSWKKLIRFYPSPGFQEEAMTIYLARDLTHGVAEPDDEEDLKRRWFTAEQIESRIRSGKIHDAKTIIGLYVWKQI